MDVLAGDWGGLPIDHVHVLLAADTNLVYVYIFVLGIGWRSSELAGLLSRVNVGINNEVW